MKFDSDPGLVETIRHMKRQGRTSAEILRYLVSHNVRGIALTLLFCDAFGLDFSDAHCIGGWWLDEGELDDDAINAFLEPVIAWGPGAYVVIVPPLPPSDAEQALNQWLRDHHLTAALLSPHLRPEYHYNVDGSISSCSYAVRRAAWELWTADAEQRKNRSSGLDSAR